MDNNEDCDGRVHEWWVELQSILATAHGEAHFSRHGCAGCGGAHKLGGNRASVVQDIIDERRPNPLLRRTRILAVQLFDRVIWKTKQALTATDVNDIGRTCLVIAVKLEEVDVKGALKFCIKGNWIPGLWSWERVLCRELDNTMWLPTVFHFLSYYCWRIADAVVGWRSRAKLEAIATPAWIAVAKVSDWPSAQPQQCAFGCMVWALKTFDQDMPLGALAMLCTLCPGLYLDHECVSTVATTITA